MVELVFHCLVSRNSLHVLPLSFGIAITSSGSQDIMTFAGENFSLRSPVGYVSGSEQTYTGSRYTLDSRYALSIESIALENPGSLLDECGN